MSNQWECIVVGGGAAGLSAALVLGRARRRTLVIDAGAQSNRASPGIGGLLGHDRRPPADLYAAGRAELAAYPSVELRDDTVVDGERTDDGFALALAGGGRASARTVLLATGMTYRLPELPGVAERWGRSVFHCPFCHGWEVRERPLGAFAPGGDGAERALLLRAWSDDVTLLTDGPARLDAPMRARLRDAGVAIDERRIAALRGQDATLEAIAFADGDARACAGLLVPVALAQRSPLAERLGATPRAPDPLAADALAVDAALATDVPGLYAAGDISVQPPSVAGAIAAGARAAGAIVGSLVGAL